MSDPQTPPVALLQDCVSTASDGTIDGELKRLADLVRCERGNNAALRAWTAKLSAPIAK